MITYECIVGDHVNKFLIAMFKDEFLQCFTLITSLFLCLFIEDRNNNARVSRKTYCNIQLHGYAVTTCYNIKRMKKKLNLKINIL